MQNKEYNQKVINLIEYVKGLQLKLDGKELYINYKEDIENVKPQEVFEIFYSLLDEGSTPEEILVFLDKVINAFYKSLLNYGWEKPKNDDFLLDLLNENEALVKKTDEIKIIMKETNLELKKEKLLPKIKELLEFNDHYLKKENILFPYMEKAMTKFQGLSIMWSLHDLVRKEIKNTIEILNDVSSDEQRVNISIANLFFGILGIKKKEELILFPSASEVLSDDDWYEMHKQSLEYEFPFINKHKELLEEKVDIFENSKFKTETGELNFEEIQMIFNALPVDMTFVDENNKVRYFTRPKDRIFPRSPAVIGRDVKNCHPPQSVHIVEEIIESFKNKEENTAKFWINVKGKLILIQYFALRDNDGNYKGILEVSQDITEIKELNGERRLLKWSNND
ncbi:MAG: putative sensor protein [Bacillota bacterium]|nr:putative sensor protein [Bacillota bacterium]